MWYFCSSLCIRSTPTRRSRWTSDPSKCKSLIRSASRNLLEMSSVKFYVRHHAHQTQTASTLRQTERRVYYKILVFLLIKASRVLMWLCVHKWYRLTPSLSGSLILSCRLMLHTESGGGCSVRVRIVNFHYMSTLLRQQLRCMGR